MTPRSVLVLFLEVLTLVVLLAAFIITLLLFLKEPNPTTAAAMLGALGALTIWMIELQRN
jgi:hypothetical protein